jgi:NADH-quinone oxidoreductase subunit J
MLSRPLHLSLPKRSYKKVGLSLGVSLVVFIMLTGMLLRTAWHPAPVRSTDWSITTIGKYLLTRYDLTFEAISLVLLVAIMGAIIITGYARRRSS